MNDLLVAQLLTKARKALMNGDKVQAALWHSQAKQAKACPHKI